MLHTSPARPPALAIGPAAPAPGRGAVDLTVVVPAYNEEHRLPRTLDTICRYLRSSPGRHAEWELIVVDDGSSDATAAVVRRAAEAEPRIRLLTPPAASPTAGSSARNHGKGHALRLGVLASRGRRVLLTDADLATPIEELAPLHDRLDAGSAAAIGSRAHPEALIEVDQHPLRRLAGRAGNRLIRAVALPGVRDTQCGFKLFDGDRARAAFGRSRLDGWGIDVEILRAFRREGWPVAEVPVRWAHQEGSKIRPLDYGRVLLELLRLARRGVRERIGAGDRAVLLAYLLLSVLLYKGLWAHVGHRYLVDSGQDQNQWEWFFAVTAHHVLGLDDPFFTGLQNAPLGVNLMANTAMLGLAVPLAPVTALFGPGATWTLVLTCGLAGTAAAWYWLLRKRFVRARRAAALGGALCAFAPPMISHANAHPNFAVLFMMPLIIDRLLRLCEGTRVRRDGVVLGLFLTYQVFLGEEALLLAALGLVLFAAGYAAARPARARAALRPLARGLAVAVAVCVPLLAYPLLWQFFGDQSYHSVLHGPAGNSPRAFVEFAGRSLAGHQATADALAMNRTEQNAFFGWPLLALTAVVVVWLWRDPRVRALGWVAFAASVLSLGRTIPVPWTGITLPGPWRALAHRPLFESVIESRVAMAAVPALGILLALACDRLCASAPAGPDGDGGAAGPGGGAGGGRGLRIAGWAAVTAALLPLAPTPFTTADRVPVPSFIADGTWRAHVPEGHTLVPVPLPSPGDAEALHWQTTAGLGFPLPGGYFNGPDGPERTGVYGPQYRFTSALLAEVSRTGRVPRIRQEQRRAAREDLEYWRAGAVVLAPQPGDEALRVTVERLLGWQGEWIGGVWVWDVHGGM
ncbi:dolichyl-phosphate beta-glucosyltransferase [Streptomyces sparsogenes]|uniref:dolichyl-phosphate beta-glucosyltransferase n=1 Tax=Streptomyces sparsogenes DSM 40356 TaxID=1331668 RepID=A0A1R1SLD5_9ACTN|nr:dolichyl-phosphate beta-glucosyltransferase [Streptomyces sparsogenes]OMI39125.1 glycosyl transferase family protein [Streptomyces sparsogenes DSM 40356]